MPASAPRPIWSKPPPTSSKSSTRPSCGIGLESPSRLFPITASAPRSTTGCAGRRHRDDVGREPHRRTEDLRHPSRMRDDGRAIPARPAPRPLPGRQAPPRPLRPRRRARRADPRSAGGAPDGHVALARAPAGARAQADRQPRRGGDAAAEPARLRPALRARGPAGQGRGAAADRLIQGARPRRGGVDGEGARRRQDRHADQRQCRRRARRLCRPRRHRDDRPLPRGHAGGQRARDRRARRARLPGQRPDRRMRRDRRRGRRARAPGSTFRR